jgi:hypothetical protein
VLKNAFSVLLFFSFTAVTSAFAVDYPAELHGKWGTSPDYCPGLEIDKKYSVQGSEMTCQAVSVKATGNKYVVKEKCSGAAAGTQNTTYVISNDTLAATFGSSTVKYKRCGSENQAKAEPAVQNDNPVMTCAVNEGQAGVTTFLDAKLKKQGNTIRDFDGYVFKADKKIKVGKTDVLVGKLLRDDGSVSEAKSYAYADEWNCK